MELYVSGSCCEAQIVGIVVESVPIDMMDKFKATKFASKFLFHHNPMHVNAV
jgi:hypothetical protein